jgi:hypothetical protein
LNDTRLFGGIYIEVPGKSFGILRNDLAPQPGRYVAPWARSETPGYAGGGTKFDLEHWNPDYFTRYGDFLSSATKRGIVAEVTLFSSHYDEAQWNKSALNPANNINSTDAVDWRKIHALENGNNLRFQEMYVCKLVRLSGASRGDQSLSAAAYPDAFPNSVEVADTLSLAWQARVFVAKRRFF